MLNIAIYQGRPTTEIEERQTSTGKAVCSFTLAVGRDYNRDEADFIDCVAWGELAGTICKNVRKGAMICVQGSTQTRNYEDKDSKKRKAVECVVRNFYFCEKKNDGTYERMKEAAENMGTGFSNADADTFKDIPVEVEDDLPF